MRDHSRLMSLGREVRGWRGKEKRRSKGRCSNAALYATVHLSEGGGLTLRFQGVRQTYFRRGAGRSLNLQARALQEQQRDVKVGLKIVAATTSLYLSVTGCARVSTSWSEDPCGGLDTSG